MRLRRGGAEWLLVLGSLLVLLAVAALGELTVRRFSDVDLLGNSRNLFVANAYGTSNGNTPNVEASSFGETVYTDQYGFRVPKGGAPQEDGRDAILILSDSVGFGPAVHEEDTFAGLLRKRFPDRRIYNSSVIGYTASDYRNVVDTFLPQHDEVKAIVLLYCLNDVVAATSENIDRHLKEEQARAEAPPPKKNLTDTLRSFRLLGDVNDYLRVRSKLYLFLRHRLLRTQLRDWRLLLDYYAANEPDVERSARDVAAIAATARSRGIPLLVVLAPWEYQLRRPDDPESEIPQRRVGELLTNEGVEFIDARPWFDAGVPSTAYFLGYDPMHFSVLGHSVIATGIAEALARRESG